MATRKNYPGSIRRRGSSYQVRLHVGGHYHAFTVDAQDQAEAEAFARSKYNELVGAPAGPPPAQDEPFSALLQRFKATELPQRAVNTQKAYTVSMAALKTFFVGAQGNPLLRSISRGQIEAFLHWRRTHKPDGTIRKTAISGRVIEKDRAMAHNLFAFAERWDLIDSNPVAKTKPPKYDKRQYVILKDDEYERLLTECDGNPFLRLFVLLLGETGMRCESEALWVRWKDVDLEGGFIWIASTDEHRTKSGQGRWVPMTPRLRAAVREHFAGYRMRLYGGARTPWVFHHPYARRRAEAGERIGSLRRAFDAASQRAELAKGFTQHDLRHRRITMWLASGKSAVLVKEAVGHSDLRTTMAYTHLAREHLRSLVENEGETKRDELDELVS